MVNRLSHCEVDAGALVNNFNELRRVSSDHTAVCPVLKANAYGHGMGLSARVLDKAGAKTFCVNEVLEAEKLRKQGMKQKIIVLGYIPPEFARDAVALDVIPVVYSSEVVTALNRAAQVQNRKIPVILKIETGTNRQGIQPRHALDLAREIKGLSNTELFGLSTHFADIEDTTDHEFAMSQLHRFMDTADYFRNQGIDPGRLSAANSAAALLWPDTHLSIIRLGIALYGMWPSKETFATAVQRHREAVDLRPVLTWKTLVAQVKQVAPGEYVGYGRTFRTTHRTVLAVIPVGYYDGYDRKASNLAHVLINGVRCQVRGRVCMNMFMVDVTDVPMAKPGDEVVLLGRQCDERITAEDLASWFDTINYEVTTRINENIPRILQNTGDKDGITKSL